MIGTHGNLAAVGWTGSVPWDAVGPVALVVAVVALALVVVLVSTQLRSRGRHLTVIRDIVEALEGLRSGRGAPRDGGGTLAETGLVLDAIRRLEEELAERSAREESTRDRLRALTESVKDGAVITTDTDGDIRSFSAGAAALFGWEENDVLARPAAILFEEDAFRHFLPKLSRKSLRERGVQARAVMQRREGPSFTAELSVTMVHGPAGESEGFVMVVRDASAQVELERQLRESEQRYRTLVDGLGDGVMIVCAGHVRYVNHALSRMLDIPAEQIVDTPLRDRVVIGDVLLVEERLEEVQSREGATDDLRFGLRVPGRRRGPIVGVHATRVEFEGRPAVLLLLRDETRERRAEAELRRNETQLDAVLEATSDGVLVLTQTPDGAIVRMTNRAFADYFGLGNASVLGLTEPALFDRLRATGGGAASLVEFLAAAGEQGRCELVSVGEGPPRQLEVAVSPLADREGRRFGRVAVVRDLTDERESQRRLQQHSEELQLSKIRLEQSYRKLDAMNRDLKSQAADLDSLNQELRKLDEMKSNLLGNVSHELQTPLVSIRGYTEMILKSRLGPITDEQRKGLELSLRNIDRLISMIDNLLVFTKSGAEVGRLHLSRFPLRPLIEESVAVVREKMEARAIAFTLDVEDEELAVHADRDKVQQVLLNLLSNAIKFNRDGGTVSIRARSGRSGFIDVSVEDTGVGIPPEAVDRVFERNYQVIREPEPKPQGSGLGLSIVRDILRLHGCRIGVESEPGRGSRFLFSLPEASATDGARPPAGQVPSRPEAPAREASSAEASPPDSLSDAATHGDDSSPQVASPASVDPDREDVRQASTAPGAEIDGTGERPEDSSTPPGPQPRFRIIRPSD